MTLSVGQVLENRYRIVSLLGQGGMGAVYRAWDLNLRVPVALKENLDLSTVSREQFEREALLLAQLNHPNLPRVTNHFTVAGQGPVSYTHLDVYKRQENYSNGQHG